jgi:hypothetical protein
MAEWKTTGETGMPRWQIYTNVPQLSPRLRSPDSPFFRLNLDSWYYSEWSEDAHPFASLGRMAIGNGPLTPARGVAAFIAQQVAVFLDAFSGVFRPVGVQVLYKPRLSGVLGHLLDVPVPETPQDVQTIQTALEQATYDGIPALWIMFEMHATVRDEHGQLTQLWLPHAGKAYYYGHHSDGSISNLPKSVAVTHILTPSAKAGIAPWTVHLKCDYVSLFRETNAEMLARVRDRWQGWLQTHPINAESGYRGDEEGESEYQEEDFVVTLAVPPPGTPPDNRDLSERNTPRLRAAIARWEGMLGTPFEWAVTL